MICDNPRNLPGFLKRSFLLYYNNGEIWCEHLDGMYQFEELIIEKFSSDIPYFTRPSQTSLIAFVMNESLLSEKILHQIIECLLNGKKIFTKVCFIGADSKTKKYLRCSMKKRNFAMEFIDDFEKAKEWLILENY